MDIKTQFSFLKLFNTIKGVMKPVKEGEYDADPLNHPTYMSAKKKKFDKFDLHYIANPFRAVLDAWVAAGGAVEQLIEPVDSLHPTQAAQVRHGL